MMADTEVTLVKKVILEDWSLIVVDNDPLRAPELKNMYLCGKVYGHPNFSDGESITTSKVLEFSIFGLEDDTPSLEERISSQMIIDSEGKPFDGYAVTQNTVYSLGVPEQEFVEFLKDYIAKKEIYQFRNSY